MQTIHPIYMQFRKNQVKSNLSETNRFLQYFYENDLIACMLDGPYISGLF